jgi:formamidopyrimidine-DNA glycosylase
MPFPEKFRPLVELRESQVSIPDHVWLSYAVCAVDEDSCGWGGWIIESAWKTVGETQEEVEVAADTDQRCPMCGKELFRTEVEKQFRFNPDAGPKIDYPYETAPIEFTNPNSIGKKS